MKRTINIAWVSLYDQRGYTRLHKVTVEGDETLSELWRNGGIGDRTDCGAPIPRHVIDIGEDVNTLWCRRCFPQNKKETN